MTMTKLIVSQEEIKLKLLDIQSAFVLARLKFVQPFLQWQNSHQKGTRSCIE